MVNILSYIPFAYVEAGQNHLFSSLAIAAYNNLFRHFCLIFLRKTGLHVLSVSSLSFYNHWNQFHHHWCSC